MLQDTIEAISTAAQDGAISIVRVSGDEAIPSQTKFFRDHCRINLHIQLLTAISSIRSTKKKSMKYL